MSDRELSDTERETLLTPCVCGHDLNDHGSLAGCWACGEVEADSDCLVTCEALIVERVGLIVAGREALAWDRGWDERDGYCSEPYSPPRENPYQREACAPLHPEFLGGDAADARRYLSELAEGSAGD